MNAAYRRIIQSRTFISSKGIIMSSSFGTETLALRITMVTPDQYYTCQFTVEKGYQCVVGRSDKQNAFYPMVDLNELGGYRMGVSRMHAVFELINGHLHVTDTSSNGTFINETRLTKDTPTRLENHSTVTFGELTFHVYVQ